MNRDKLIELGEHLDQMRTEPSAHQSDTRRDLRMIDVLALKKPFYFCNDLWAADTQYGICGGTAAHAVWLFRDYIKEQGGGGLYWSGMEVFSPEAEQLAGAMIYAEAKEQLDLMDTDARHLLVLREMGGAANAWVAAMRCHRLAAGRTRVYKAGPPARPQ